MVTLVVTQAVATPVEEMSAATKGVTLICSPNPPQNVMNHHLLEETINVINLHMIRVA